MKKYITVILLFSALIGFSQTKIIELDPIGCSSTNFSDYLKEGSRLSVKIKNVNPFAVKIKINESADTIDFDMPAIFSLSFSGAKEAGTTKKDQKNPTFGFTAFDSSKNNRKASNIDTLNKRLNSCLIEFKQNVLQLQRHINLELKVKNLMGTPLILKDDLVKKIHYLIKCDGGDTVDCCWYKDRFNYLNQQIRVSYDCIKDNVAEIKKELGEEEPVIAVISGNLQDKEKKVTVTVDKAKVTINTKKEIQQNEELLGLDAFMMKISSDSSIAAMTEKIDNLTSMCIDLQMSGPFELCQSPLYVSGDRYTLYPSILGLKGDTIFKFNEITFHTYGGFRLNFSTGIAFTAFSQNQTYFKEKTPGDSFYVRNGKEQNQFIPSIAAFLHAYWRTKCRLTPAMTVGFSTDPTSFETTRFFAGGSIIFGEYRRFIISGGFTGGQVDRLVNKFKKDNIYAEADFKGLDEKDYVGKKFRTGIFVGFSYNLSAKR